MTERIKPRVFKSKNPGSYILIWVYTDAGELLVIYKDGEVRPSLIPIDEMLQEVEDGQVDEV